ncbi:TnsA endonuclease N-terminal domain-containing protein [Cohnella lupini]|uniref:TnsA endonuclease-like protein n=1 Tax=Cohnella lupini TaxID=1294267 RepID=A0A3D9HTZ6_9BACL|nr:TnsA endonuclease N-terminal domain-containing protein [Cohnella lupini]RED52895.1 TnsA endonuclease-like protein [Cohnella lupini]
MQEVIARKIGPKRKGFRGKEPFLKSGEMVHWDSYLERDYIRLADFDAAVEEIYFQPVCIRYTYMGKTRRYYPDFKIISPDGHVIVIEVKPTKYLRHPKNIVKYEVGKQFCEGKGWTFVIVTEEQIRPGYLQNNLALLRAYGFEDGVEHVISSIKEKMTVKHQCYIFELREEFMDVSDHDFQVALYRLIYLEELLTDLIKSHLTEESIIKMNLEGGE